MKRSSRQTWTYFVHLRPRVPGLHARKSSSSPNIDSKQYFKRRYRKYESTRGDFVSHNPSCQTRETKFPLIRSHLARHLLIAQRDLLGVAIALSTCYRLFALFLLIARPQLLELEAAYRRRDASRRVATALRGAFALFSRHGRGRIIVSLLTACCKDPKWR